MSLISRLFLALLLALRREGILKVHQEVVHHRVNGRLDLREGTVDVVAFLFSVLVCAVIIEIVLEDLTMLVIGLDS